MDEQRGCTPCTYARRAPLGCFQITALKQGNVVHPCTAFLPFKYAKILKKGGARRACVHAVHPPVSATSYKRADFEERGEFFPNSIFPDFSRAFPAKTSIETPLEAKLKIQRSSYWRIEARIEDRRSRASIGRKTSRYLFARRWLGFLLNCFLLEWWVAKSFGILGWDVGIELWNLSWMFKNNVCGCLIWNERLSWLFGCST